MNAHQCSLHAKMNAHCMQKGLMTDPLCKICGHHEKNNNQSPGEWPIGIEVWSRHLPLNIMNIFFHSPLQSNASL